MSSEMSPEESGMMPAGDFPDFLEGDAEEVARRLLGCYLIRTFDPAVEYPAGQGREGTVSRVVVRIVETEAYDQNDPASHAYHGKSERNKALFGPAGHLYVYFTYGMHYCANVTCGDDGFGAGALIRAVEPVDGQSREVLLARRGLAGATGKRAANATNGPAKLCKALDIDKRLYAHDLRRPPLQLVSGNLLPGEKVQATERIGISKAAEVLRRFVIEGNPYLSR
ncbi:MAG: DNA-3-methyladenine glycosylase [Bifidobacteriaceae bacterium]|jgi:DNA-3-methyladenine glycosylase|nr:DNA-3-methyladenine glycosylase [Bifidobacteriaceae bacterium]MCI1978997.1 DNA-3-methyladenine glycosylase [Bifidobacteriaceae bacterium]